MKWANALSTATDLQQAVNEVCEQLHASFTAGEADLALAFAAGHSPAQLAGLAPSLQHALGDGLVLGCNGSGVIAAAQELEEGPALAVLAAQLSEVDLAAAHLDQSLLPPVSAAREKWWRLIGVRPESEPAFLLIADPYSFDVEHCVRGLDRAYPGATVVGGLTSAVSQPGQSMLLLEQDVFHDGALLLALSGGLRMTAVVSQGCRPVGEPLFVTACEDNRIRELDGKAPRDVLGEVYSSLSAADRELFNARQLRLGLALPGPRQTVGAGDFLLRDVVGLDAESGELVIGARPAANTVVQFHLRDAGAATADLGEQLQRQLAAEPQPPEAALMFACVGRGAGLFGVSGCDVGLFRRSYGEVPLAGLFCAGEIGPVQAATFLHGYSTVIGLIRRR